MPRWIVYAVSGCYNMTISFSYYLFFYVFFLQDTVKYVENQVQTVGAGVKRFYSDVMQDINPESHIDPVKVSAGDLSLNPYAHFELKRKSSAKKDVFENSERLADDYKVISGTDKFYLLCLFTLCLFSSGLFTCRGIQIVSFNSDLFRNKQKWSL